MANAKVPAADGYYGKSVGMMEKAGVPTTQNDDVIAKTEVPGTAGYHRKRCTYQRRQKSLVLPDITETVCTYQRRQKSLALPDITETVCTYQRRQKCQVLSGITERVWI